MAKSWYKSLAITLGGIVVLINYAEAQGLVPAGLGQSIANTVEALLSVGTVYGFRRAMG